MIASFIIAIILIATSIFLVVSTMLTARKERLEKEKHKLAFRDGYEMMQQTIKYTNYEIYVNGVKVNHFPRFDEEHLKSYVIDDLNRMVFICLE